eukprot:g50969.t1
MSGFDYVALHGNPAASLRGLPRLVMGTAGVMLSTLFMGMVGRKARYLFMGEGSKSNSFYPAYGINTVLVKPGQPPLLSIPAAYTQSSSSGCFFTYLPREQPGVKDFQEGARFEAAVVYGAELYHQDKNGVPSAVAVPDGDPEHVVKARLICWDGDEFLSKIPTADQLHGLRPEDGEEGVKRGEVVAVRKDGSTQAAIWYYQDTPSEGSRLQTVTTKAPKAKTPNGSAKDPNIPLFYRLDIRVGQIVEAAKHPNADTMYVEKIDIGEEEPRTVCSGVYGRIPHEQFEGARVLVVTNLKPSNLRNVTSYGMVLCASSEDKGLVELVSPPEDAPVGSRVFLEGDQEEVANWPAEAEVNGKNKKSAWARAAPALAVDKEGVMRFEGKVVRTFQGPIRAPTLRGVKVA